MAQLVQTPRNTPRRVRPTPLVPQGARPPDPDTLRDTLERRLDLAAEEAHALAETVSALFGTRTHIEDEPLDKATRALMYRLQSGGIVRSHTVEAKNEQGRDWLYFHWILDGERLERLRTDGDRPKGPAAHRGRRHPAAPPAAVA